MCPGAIRALPMQTSHISYWLVSMCPGAIRACPMPTSHISYWLVSMCPGAIRALPMQTSHISYWLVSMCPGAIRARPMPTFHISYWLVSMYPGAIRALPMQTSHISYWLVSMYPVGMRLLCSKTCLLCYAAILLKCPYYAQQSTYYAAIMPSFFKITRQGRSHFSFKTETLKSITSYTGCWGPIMPLQAPIMLTLCSMLSHTYYAQFYAGIIASCLVSRCYKSPPHTDFSYLILISLYVSRCYKLSPPHADISHWLVSICIQVL